MEQVYNVRRQPTAQSSATLLNRSLQITPPVFAGGSTRRVPSAGHPPPATPPLTNGDPPPLMLWGEEA